jgi:hypothetical protein
MSDTHEHLEHAEHAQHAAHDSFDKRIALTIAIIAAVLAAVTLLSHRAHNETLQLQIEAGILQGQATDKWAEFQANNSRRHEYEQHRKLLEFLTKDPAKTTEASSTLLDWGKKVEAYRPGQTDGEEEKRGKLERLEDEARALDRQVEEKRHDSHFAHDRGSRFDLGELAVELGLVLCSIAILTKRRGFWYTGAGSAVVGAAIAATVLFMAPHAAEGHGHGADTAAEHRSTDRAPGH